MRTASAILALCLILFLASGAFAISNTGLKGYWTLNETSGNPADTSGQNVSATASNITYDLAGKVGRDFNFVVSPSKSKVDLNASTYWVPANFTWCFWGWKNTAENETYFFITKTDTSIGGYGDLSYSFDWGWQQSTQFAVFVGGTQKQVAYGNVPINEWHFYCGSFDGTRAYGYLDGVAKTPIATGGAPNATNGSLLFGARADNYTGHKGRLDEVSFWDRNLSAQDIADLYNAGAGTTYCQASGTFASTCPVRVDFNVYQAGTTTHLTGVTIDCNDNTYDLSNQTSPFFENMALNTYSCSFSKTGYDTNTNFQISVTGAMTQVITLALSDACARTLNVDWIVSSAIDCNQKAINLGTGKLILSTGAKLRLFDSNLICKQFDINASGSELHLGSGSWFKVG